MSDAFFYLSELRIDGDTQARVAMDDDEIEYFAGIMREHGEQACPFPAVKVVYDGKEKWLYDGFHRYHAALKAGYSKLRATVEQGTLEDARWKCLGVNVKRAIPRTKEDKRNAVLRALAHPRGQGASDGLIAQHCGVSQAYVGKIKKTIGTSSNDTTINSLELNNSDSSPAVNQEPNVAIDSQVNAPQKIKKTRNGKTMDTTNIGKRAKKPQSVPDQEPPVVPTSSAPIPPHDMIYINRHHCYHAIDCECHKDCISGFGEPIPVNSAELDDIFA